MALSALEQLQDTAYIQSIHIRKHALPERVKGLYFEEDKTKVITINRNVDSRAEEACIMAEELGHSVVGGGDLLFGNIDGVTKRKLEHRARGWAYNRLLPPKPLLRLLKRDFQLCEIAEEFDVTENFVKSAIEYYLQKGDLPMPGGGEGGDF